MIEGLLADVERCVEIWHALSDADDGEDQQAHDETDDGNAASSFGAVVLVDEIGDEKRDGKGEHASGVLNFERAQVIGKKFDAYDVGDDQARDARGREPREEVGLTREVLGFEVGHDLNSLGIDTGM